MSYIGRFFGVNKHRSEDINDLNGAAKDATALWSLFTDNISEMDSKLLVDEKATHQSMVDTVNEIVQGAESDDVVILTFSGHGSRDHHLVFHDTTTEDFGNTSVAMTTVANEFKKSKARAILIVLDCCFSGDAASKVLEDSPQPRDFVSPYPLFDGKGRVLLAAANYDEPAYELPTTGHGILTKSVLDCILANKESFDLGSLVPTIIESVRAEASKIGRVQTPVAIGYFEGGLTMPVFTPGENYKKHFPQYFGVSLSGPIHELKSFGVPPVCLDTWGSQFATLNALQLEAVNSFGVMSGQSLFVVAPTSSGKTFIGEMAGLKSISEGKKVIFLLPYRALVNEKHAYFTKLYADRLGLRILRCSGDYTDQITPFLKGKFDLALFTYEMFLSLTTTYPHSLNQVGVVVLDEAQFITDPKRGITVELILTLLNTRKTEGVRPQIIALSAVVGSINHFDEWMGIKTLQTDERPVPLIEGVIDRSGRALMLNEDGSEQETQIVGAHAIVQRKKKPSSQDLLVPLVQELLKTDQKLLIFRNMRGRAEGCAEYLAKDLRLASVPNALEQLPTHDLSSTSGRLRNCLSAGTAFHSTNLSRLEREVVETEYRKTDSNLRVLASTTTLAAGINTPASTVILAEQEFVGTDGRPFTVAEYKNMAGRAGRLGFNEKGKCLILAENSIQKQQLFRKYVQGELEPIRSSFHTDEIDNWAVRLLTQVDKVLSEELAEMLISTYGGYLEVRQRPSFQKTMSSEIQWLVQEMLRLGLLETEDKFVRLSLLGRVCGGSSLPLASSMTLVNLFKNNTGLLPSGRDILALLQVLPDADVGFIPTFKKGQSELAWPRFATGIFGSEIVKALQLGAKDTYAYASRCKKACILVSWIQGESMEGMEKQYTKNPFYRVGHGDVTRLSEAARYHLSSAVEILRIIHPAADLDEVVVDELSRQLQLGIPKSSLGLLELPFEMTRGEYLALGSAGIMSEELFWSKNDEELKGILGETRAQIFLDFRPRE